MLVVWFNKMSSNNNNLRVNVASIAPSEEELQFEQTNHHDRKVVAYLKKQSAIDVRTKREEHVHYMSSYKQLMIQFLTTIFPPNQPVTVPSLTMDLQPQKFSIFEGISPQNLPDRNSTNNIALQHNSDKRLDIFSEKDEHEQLVNKQASI